MARAPRGACRCGRGFGRHPGFGRPGRARVRRVHGAPADVVEVKLRLASDESGTRIAGSTVTVSYTDAAGVRRWATRLSRETGMVIGPGGAEVLFDPARPGDEKSVFVALQRHPVLADWLPAGRT